MRLLTVSDFAREKGIGLSTVQRWVRIGKIQGLIKSGRSYLIPESNLSLQIDPRKKKQRKRTPVMTPSQARKAYSNYIEDEKNKLKISYDELKEMFDKGMTLEAIASELNVTKQRVSQIYQHYFSFGVDGYKRRSSIQHELARDKSLKKTLDSERISHLGKTLSEVGLSMKPVQLGKGPTFYHNVVEVNGHLCKIHLSRKDTQFAGHNYRAYSRFLVTRSHLDDYEFVIVIAGEEEKRRVFVIPTEILKKQFRKMDHRKSFYLPTGEKEPYRNIYPLLDWWKYLGAWHLLQGESSN